MARRQALSVPLEVTLTEAGRDAASIHFLPPPSELSDLILSLTTDKTLALSETLKIHVWVTLYILSLRSAKVRKKNNTIVFEIVPANKSAIGALKRLRTARGHYARTKAFYELPPSAREALQRAAKKTRRFGDEDWRPSSDFITVPDGKIVASLVPKAIKIGSMAMLFTKKNPNRNRAIEEIMRVHRHLHGGKKPPVKSFRYFLERIAACYQQLLPEGFGGGIRSNNTYDATFRGILKLSLTD